MVFAWRNNTHPLLVPQAFTEINTTYTYKWCNCIYSFRTNTCISNLLKVVLVKGNISIIFFSSRSQFFTPYTTNPHECLASNGRARCLPSARRAATERLLSSHQAKSLSGHSVAARWSLAERSADTLLGHCSPSARGD